MTLHSSVFVTAWGVYAENSRSVWLSCSRWLSVFGAFRPPFWTRPPYWFCEFLLAAT